MACHHLPRYFPVSWFDGLQEGNRVAFPLRGKIVILQLSNSDEVARDIEADSYKEQSIYFFERDSSDLYDSNRDRMKNKKFSSLKFSFIVNRRVYAEYSEFIQKKLCEESCEKTDFIDTEERYGMSPSILPINRESIRKKLIEAGEKESLVFRAISLEESSRKQAEIALFSKVNAIFKQGVQKGESLSLIFSKVYLFTSSWMNERREELIKEEGSDFGKRIIKIEYTRVKTENVSKIFIHLYNLFLNQRKYSTGSYFTLMKYVKLGKIYEAEASRNSIPVSENDLCEIFEREMQGDSSVKDKKEAL